MRNVGLILAGMSLSTGLTAVGLFSLNLIVWGILAAWTGSLLAFLGFFCIFWALRPRPAEDEDTSDELPAGLPPL